MGVELDGPEPMYKQIARILTARIKAGEYKPGKPIPSAAALCEEFGVSRRTVMSATDILTEQGLTVPSIGKGIYVAPQDKPAGE
jgi:DNA-binding GntR family transcriptional regulator